MTLGDRAPNFVLPDASGRFVMFYERTQGRPVTLLLLPASAMTAGDKALQAFQRQMAAFATAGIDVFAVCGAMPDTMSEAPENAAASSPLLWWDKTGKILSAFLSGLRAEGGLAAGANFGADDGCALLLDANQRILGLIEGDDELLPERVLRFYRGQPAPKAPIRRRATAPILMIPRLLSTDWCRRLLAAYEGRKAAVASGLGTAAMRPDATVPLISVLDRDGLLGLRAVLGRRLVSELYKAFSFKLSNLAELNLHRCETVVAPLSGHHTETDRMTRPTKPSFSMIVNLSPTPENGGDDDYDRSAFVFPEYDSAEYWPEIGVGLVYAGDLLVQSRPAISGSPYLLRGNLQG